MKRMVLTMVGWVLVTVLFACGRGEVALDARGLARVEDSAHLDELMYPDPDSAFFDRFFPRNGGDAIPEDDLELGSGDGDASDDRAHSDTNVQVEGIDESDIVKTDGDRIYYIRHNALSVIEVGEEGAMEIILDRVQDDAMEGHYTELYLTDDYLIVLGMFYETEEEERKEPSDPSMEGMFHFPVHRTMSTVEIFDKASLEPVSDFKVSGHLNSSRLFEDTLYLISTHRTRGDHEDKRPYFHEGDSKIEPTYDEIAYLPDMPHSAFTVITAIDLDETPAMNYDIFLGEGYSKTMYMSEHGIYLASNYSKNISRDDDIVDDSSTHGRVLLYRFLADGTIEYGGHGDYKGRLINQFAMDEHDGVLRMVTTDGWGDSTINRLYTFEADTDEEDRPYLRRLALLDEGIGKPRENVRSARFNDDTLTVVTFEQTDPFYVIDVSDPENPVIEGELEMPGFSTYQHPWKADTVIGIGYETDENGQTTGLKFSLYDIEDGSAPAEIGESLVLLNEEGSQYGEALHNHKAILISEDHDFIGFAIGSAIFSSGYRHVGEYLVLSIDQDKETPISVEASISHDERFDEDENPWYYGFAVNRAVTIDDQLYVLSPGAITRHAITDDFEELEAMVFSTE